MTYIFTQKKQKKKSTSDSPVKRRFCGSSECFLTSERAKPQKRACAEELKHRASRRLGDLHRFPTSSTISRLLSALRSPLMATENPRLGDPSAAALDGAGVSGTAAVCACAAMAFFYVAILYSPTLILRLPPPTSVESFFLRRFGCAAISSAASVAASAALLGVRCCPCLSCSKSVASILLGILFLLQQVWRSGDLSLILGVFGIRRHQLVCNRFLDLVSCL